MSRTSLKSLLLLMLCAFSIHLGFADDSLLDYYSDLGAQKDEPLDAIKSKYRRLAVRFHPDKNPGDKNAADTFTRIGEAWEIIENHRAAYDKKINELGRLPTKEEFDPITDASHEKTRANQAAAEAEAMTHTASIATDPKVDAFLQRQITVTNAFSQIKEDAFWKTFLEQNKILEKEFLKIVEDQGIDGNEKIRAFNSYYYEHLYGLFSKRDLSARRWLTALDLLNAPLSAMKGKISQTAIDAVDTYSASITRKIFEVMPAEKQKTFFTELNTILHDATETRLAFRAIRRVKGRERLDPTQVDQAILQSPHVYTQVMQKLIADKDSKQLDRLLEASLSRLEAWQATPDAALSSNEQALIEAYLAQIEAIKDQSKLKTSHAKASEFFKTERYAQLKKRIGHAVPARSKALIDFEVFVELQINRIQNLNRDQLTHEKNGLVKELENSITKYWDLLSDGNVDSYDQDHATVLISRATQAINAHAISNLPLENIEAFLRQYEDMNSAKGIDPQTTLHAEVRPFFLNEIYVARSDEIKKSILNKAAEKKTAEAATQLHSLFRPHVSDMDSALFTLLKSPAAALPKRKDLSFSTLSQIWGNDVSRGTSDPHFKSSLQLLTNAVADTALPKGIASIATSQLQRARKTVKTTDAATSYTIRDQTMTSLKAGGFGCTKRILHYLGF